MRYLRTKPKFVQLVAGGLLVTLTNFACSSSGKFVRQTQELKEGLTTKQEVIQKFGQPAHIGLGNTYGGESLVYVQSDRRTGEGALIGAGTLGVASTVVAILLIPLTFGLSLILIPIGAGAGGVVGGLGGTVVKTDVKELRIHLDSGDIAQKIEWVNLKNNGDVKVLESGTATVPVLSTSKSASADIKAVQSS